jgi:hypothetical protein
MNERIELERTFLRFVVGAGCSVEQINKITAAMLNERAERTAAPQPAGEPPILRCMEPAGAAFSPFHYFCCVLPKGHEGEHRRGGNCTKHGEYVGDQCPEWPSCVKEITEGQYGKPVATPAGEPLKVCNHSWVRKGEVDGIVCDWCGVLQNSVTTVTYPVAPAPAPDVATEACSAFNNSLNKYIKSRNAENTFDPHQATYEAMIEVLRTAFARLREEMKKMNGVYSPDKVNSALQIVADALERLLGGKP